MNKKKKNILKGLAVAIPLFVALFYFLTGHKTIPDLFGGQKETISDTIPTKIIGVEVKDSAKVDMINQQIGGTGNTQNNTYKK